MSISNLPVIDRIPPQNLEAEMALIGSVLVDREIMGVVSEIVRPEDFYAHIHESIYSALVHLYDRGEPLDKITVAEELKQRNQLESVGGLPYLSSLMDTVQTAASASYYAKIVREKSVLRGLIHAGTRITQLGYEHEEDVEGALDQSEQMVYQIGMRQNTGEFTPVSRLLKPAFEHIDKLFHSRGDRTGLTAGFRDIDEMTTGFQPGNFVIVAARPGMGKTSFALNMAVAAAREESEPVAFFSLEMSNDELVQRLICSEARISMHDMRRGNIKTHHWEKISDAMGVLNELPIYLDDAGGLSVTEIRSRCRRLKSGHGLSAAFVDYLQLLRPGVLSKGANRNEEPLGHLPHAQNDGQGFGHSDHCARAIESRRRNAQRQAPDAQRLARFGILGARSRHGCVLVSRGLLQQRNARTGLDRIHRSQAPERTNGQR